MALVGTLAAFLSNRLPERLAHVVILQSDYVNLRTPWYGGDCGYDVVQCRGYRYS